MASSEASSRARGPPSTASPPDENCGCGLKKIMKTSWTIDNPGRRFVVCGQRVNGCGSWDWYDLEMTDRAKYLISDLKHKVERLEAELETRTAEPSRVGGELTVHPTPLPSGTAVTNFQMHVIMFVAGFASALFAFVMGTTLGQP